LATFRNRKSIRKSDQRGSTTAPRKRDSITIPTGSRILPDGSFLELVRDPKTGHVLLQRWTDGPSNMSREFQYHNAPYVPSESAGVIRHLPSIPVPYGSTKKLFSGVAQFIRKYSGLDADKADVFAFFSIASFFNDCQSLAPSLLLFGSPIHAVSTLRILGCTCRHPILLAESRIGGLPPELRHPTRLICQTDAPLDRHLAAFQFAGFSMGGSERQNINGATAIYAGEAELKSAFAQVCLEFPVLSRGPSFSVHDEELEILTITRMQNQLLAYRLENYSKVKASRFDVPEFSGFTREFARTLGSCIVDAPDLQKRLIDLLRPHDEADRAECTTELQAVVLEALVVCCHERRASVHVGEITSLANAILTRSSESVQLRPKQVGATLKKVGIRTMRLDAAGRGIYLLNDACQRIHDLGHMFGIATLREGLPGCCYCRADAHDARRARVLEPS
jgi:hypothetical protein